MVAGDNTVRYKNRSLQIPADCHRHHYVKARVRVATAIWRSSSTQPLRRGRADRKTQTPGRVIRFDVDQAPALDKWTARHKPT